MQSIEPRRIQNYTKGTTRPKRGDDRGELRHFDSAMPEQFDIVYVRQTHSYGIASNELWRNLANGKISLLVVSDSKTIDLLLERLRIMQEMYNIYNSAATGKSGNPEFKLTHYLSAGRFPPAGACPFRPRWSKGSRR